MFGDANLNWVTVAPALASAVAATASAYAAVALTRNQTRAELGAALLHIARVFESEEFRRYRKIIYEISRDAYPTWSVEERAAVDHWCAHLDVVSSLIRGGQIDVNIYLNLYGDVTFRTIYQIAPYCNSQFATRGQQFLLPLRLVTTDLIKKWKRARRLRHYPSTIGFPALPQVRVNPDLFDGDPATNRFIVKRRIPPPN